MRGEKDSHYDVRDRFGWLRPTEIAEHCQELARDLRRKGVVRTRQERLELTLDIAAILTRIAEQITGEIHGGSQTPERRCVLVGHRVSEAYLDFIRGEIHSARCRALEREAELVLGEGMRDWIHSAMWSEEARDIRNVI